MAKIDRKICENSHTALDPCLCSAPQDSIAISTWRRMNRSSDSSGAKRCKQVSAFITNYNCRLLQADFASCAASWRCRQKKGVGSPCQDERLAIDGKLIPCPCRDLEGQSVGPFAWCLRGCTGEGDAGPRRKTVQRYHTAIRGVVNTTSPLKFQNTVSL